jgi:hypothetical protein
MAIVEQAAGDGPIFYDRISVVGDGAYTTGGSPAAGGFEALFQAAVGAARTIIAVHQDHDTELNALEYDHTNDKLFARVKTTGVESAVADQSGITYILTVISK